MMENEEKREKQLPLTYTLYLDKYKNGVIFMLRITKGKDIIDRKIPVPSGWRFINQFYYREKKGFELFGPRNAKPNLSDALIRYFDFDFNPDMKFVE